MLPCRATRPVYLKKLHSYCSHIFRSVSDQSLVLEKETRTSLKMDKKPYKPPFMKNIFIGVFDEEMLSYPELDKERLIELKKRAQPYNEFFKDNVDPTIISSLKIIPSEIKDSLKNLGLYGQIIPSIYGGAEQTATETAYINEIVGKDIDIALTLYCHNFLAVQSIVLYGSPQQKEKYLPLLASGEMIAAFCMSESTAASDIASIKTTAVLSEDNSDITVVNGEKRWVINGGVANLFVVLVKSDYKSHTGKILPLVRFLLIERDSPGVTISSPMEHLGLDASNICEVHFKDTPVDINSFIGNEMQGFEMCATVMNSGRYNLGSITISVLKKLLKIACEFVESRKQFERQLIECEQIQNKVTDIANCIYVLESMVYLTTSLLDSYDNPDCSLELAIIKVFSFTEGRRAVDLILELMGGRAFLKSQLVEQYFRDFRTMEVFDGTTDYAKLYISLMGLQHAGKTMFDTVAKMRSPLEYPTFILKRAFKSINLSKENPKLTLELFKNLHPSLTKSANELEYCVLRFHWAVSTLFNRYGTDAVNQQVELMRLSDAAVRIYAMTAALGRSSRSYCIGLRNAETELKCAINICSSYKNIVQLELNDIIDGFAVSGDAFSFRYGPDIFNHHGYFVEHPLERSF